MRVGFAGTPDFAAEALAAILRAGFDVPLVLTQPDRPKGRGLAVTPSPVRRLSAARGLVVATPASLKSAEAREPIVSVPLDVLVVAAYGLILPAEVLNWPTHGCLNIHASLLPRWRGAAPIARAILAGDPETGITIMQMDQGLDTGPILSRHPVPIEERETAGSLHDRLAGLGASAIVDVLTRLGREQALTSRSQPDDGATYAAKIRKDDTAIHWSGSAIAIDRQVRAFDPAPGAFTVRGGELWKIWRAQPLPADSGTPAPPGTIERADTTIVVACGDGSLAIEELQASGGRRTAAAAVAAGRRLRAGDRFDVRPKALVQAH